jgi:small-conductance mechanosensitive channel
MDKIVRTAILLLCLASACPLLSQETPPGSEKTSAIPQDESAKPAVSPAPSKVDVEPTASDPDIASRLERIMRATEWFTDPSVKVDEGVVFLRGRTSRAEYRDWAGDLAAKTQDVVAVVNHVEVTERSAWDFTPAWAELRQMGRNLIAALPLITLGIVILLVTHLAAKGTGRAVDFFGRRKMPNSLLRRVAVKAAMIPVWLLGIYFVLRTSGLTQMALTVLGGTGLAGLIIGIAFQNIAENLLASILISVQRPFQPNDFIEVAGFKGMVQRVTARGTVLITPDGNHVQIPNAMIYKGVIRNFSANPNVRIDFTVGIDYENSTSRAQDLVLEVVRSHGAVLKTPEPLVLVDELGQSAVVLHIYFWISAREHDGMKTKSSLMRLVKKSLQEAAITLPDPAREVILPRGVEVRIAHEAAARGAVRSPAEPASDADGEPVRPAESSRISRMAEGELHSDVPMMKQQAAHSRQVEEGPDLLAEASRHSGNGTSPPPDGKQLPQ